MPRTDLFGVKPRRPRRVLLHVADAGAPHGDDPDDSDTRYWLRMVCRKCGHVMETHGTVTESRNMPCPNCNKQPAAPTSPTTR